jgi:hypothetical protein
MVTTFDTGFCETFGCWEIDIMCRRKIFCPSMVTDIPVSEGVQKMPPQILRPRND